MPRAGSSRRGFLVGLVAVPAVFLGARAIGAIRGAARVVRPGALSGSSATRCALCGATGHAMLRCPHVRKVR